MVFYSPVALQRWLTSSSKHDQKEGAERTGACARVLYLWQGVLGKPHLDKLVPSIGDKVLGAIPRGDLRGNKPDMKEKNHSAKMSNIPIMQITLLLLEPLNTLKS